MPCGPLIVSELGLIALIYARLRVGIHCVRSISEKLGYLIDSESRALTRRGQEN